MGKIKHLILVLMLCPFMSCSQNDKDMMEIGVLENDILKITADKVEVITMLNENLKISKVEGKIVDIKLKTDTVEGAQEKSYFMLLGSNGDESIKIAVLLTLEKSKLYGKRLSGVNGFYSTCTCSGSCTQGCDPKRWVDDDNEIVWKCSACVQQNKICNKSVTTN